MVIDHTSGLHEGVTNGRSHELESRLAERLAHGIGLGRPCRHLGHAIPGILDRPVIDEAPEEAAEGLASGGEGQVGAGILESGSNLQAVADDTWVCQQGSHLVLAVAGDKHRIEAVKGPPVAFPFLEDGGPGKASLCALQNQELEERAIVI